MTHRGGYASACITGASSGIGAAFARALAGPGVQLELVARDEARLETLATTLAREAGAICRVQACDLAHPEAVEELARRLEAEPPALLVNNAALGYYGGFAAADAASQLTMVDLNVRALVALSHAYLRGALQRGSGALLLVASAAGTIPVPYSAVYAASKSFVLHFGEALWEESRQSPVRVLTLCPGFTATRFAARAGGSVRLRWGEAVPPEIPVALALAALRGNAATVVQGQGNRVIVQVGRMLPRRLLLVQLGRWMRRRLDAQATTAAPR